MRDALSTKIASELCARIQSGELKENDKLPSERILASQYDVSRNVIREIGRASCRERVSGIV